MNWELVARYSLITILLLSLFSIWTPQTRAEISEPTTASFGAPSSTGDVNLYTGDLNLQVPLLTIPGRGGFDFPLAISYTPGVHYHELAPSLGEGWSLNIPTIKRQVNGLPDDYGYSGKTNYDYYNGLKSVQYNTVCLPEEPSDTIRALQDLSPFMSFVGFFPYGSTLGVAFNLYSQVSMISENPPGIACDITTNPANAYSSYTLPGFYRANGDSASYDYDGDMNLDVGTPDIYSISGNKFTGAFSPITYSLNDGPTEYFQPLQPLAEKQGGGKAPYKNYVYMKILYAGKDSMFDTSEAVGRAIDGFLLVGRDGTKYVYQATTVVKEKFLRKALNSIAKDGICGFDDEKDYIETKLKEEYATVFSIKYILSPEYPKTVDDINRVSDVEVSDDTSANWVEFVYDYNPLSWGTKETRTYTDPYIRTGANNDYPDDDPSLKNHEAMKTTCRTGPDGKKYYSYEITATKYLKEIITPTHKAVFKYETRDDALDYNGKTSYKISSISLFHRLGSAVAESSSTSLIKYVFDYDYSLVDCAPDNKFSDGTTCGGRLTLRSVTRVDSKGESFPPTTFYYNPTFKYGDEKWNIADYYCPDCRDDNVVIDHMKGSGNPFMGSLSKVVWESGAQTGYEYELKTIDYINNVDPALYRGFYEYNDGTADSHDELITSVGMGLKVKTIVTCPIGSEISISSSAVGDGSYPVSYDPASCVVRKFKYGPSSIDVAPPSYSPYINKPSQFGGSPLSTSTIGHEYTSELVCQSESQCIEKTSYFYTPKQYPASGKYIMPTIIKTENGYVLGTSARITSPDNQHIHLLTNSNNLWAAECGTALTIYYAQNYRCRNKRNGAAKTSDYFKTFKFTKKCGDKVFLPGFPDSKKLCCATINFPYFPYNFRKYDGVEDSVIYLDDAEGDEVKSGYSGSGNIFFIKDPDSYHYEETHWSDCNYYDNRDLVENEPNTLADTISHTAGTCVSESNPNIFSSIKPQYDGSCLCNTEDCDKVSNGHHYMLFNKDSYKKIFGFNPDLEVDIEKYLLFAANENNKSSGLYGKVREEQVKDQYGQIISETHYTYESVPYDTVELGSNPALGKVNLYWHRLKEVTTRSGGVTIKKKYSYNKYGLVTSVEQTAPDGSSFISDKDYYQSSNENFFKSYHTLSNVKEEKTKFNRDGKSYVRSFVRFNYDDSGNIGDDPNLYKPIEKRVCNHYLSNYCHTYTGGSESDSILVEKYSYDSVGNLDSITNVYGKKVTTFFGSNKLSSACVNEDQSDELKRSVPTCIESWTDVRSQTKTQKKAEYDSRLAVSKIKSELPSNSAIEIVSSFVYDGFGRLLKVFKENDPDVSDNVAVLENEYEDYAHSDSGFNTVLSQSLLDSNNKRLVTKSFFDGLRVIESHMLVDMNNNGVPDPGEEVVVSGLASYRPYTQDVEKAFKPEIITNRNSDWNPIINPNEKRYSYSKLDAKGIASTTYPPADNGYDSDSPTYTLDNVDGVIKSDLCYSPPNCFKIVSGRSDDGNQLLISLKEGGEVDQEVGFVNGKKYVISAKVRFIGPKDVNGEIFFGYNEYGLNNDEKGWWWTREEGATKTIDFNGEWQDVSLEFTYYKDSSKYRNQRALIKTKGPGVLLVDDISVSVKGAE